MNADDMPLEDFTATIDAMRADLRELGIEADTVSMSFGTAQKLWPRWHVCPRCHSMIAADNDSRWVDFARKWSWRIIHKLNCH